MVYRFPDREYAIHLSEAWSEYEKITRPARIALLHEIAVELSEEAYRPEPESQDPVTQASNEGYQEGLKWAAKKLRWRAAALEAAW